MYLPSYQNNFYNPYCCSPNNSNSNPISHSNQGNIGPAVHNKPYDWINFSACDMCLISNTIPNDNCDVVNRFLSRVSIYQTDNNSNEKILSIFVPMIKEWAFSNGISENGTADLARIFNIGDDVVTNRNKSP